MARKQEATKLLLNGLSPLQIAREMGVTLSTVKNYLYTQVGEGVIQRSDIVLSFPPSLRRAVEKAIAEGKTDSRTSVQRRLDKAGIATDAEELFLYLQLRRLRVEFGDLYEWLRVIEVHLHELARTSLEGKYGDRWWRHLPVKVRQDCSLIYEEDENEPEHRYCCTTFIHLNLIYKQLWDELSPGLPKAFSSSDKGRFLRELTFINSVRNAVMHPVKGLHIDEESFRRVHQFAQILVGKNPPASETWGSILSMPVRSPAVQ